jgi:hypothetical protein
LSPVIVATPDALLVTLVVNGEPFLVYIMVYEVLAPRPEILILPSIPAHTVGFTEVTLPAVGVGGPALTVTTTVAAGEVQPVMDWVTLMV